jgi:hypothetical protein
MAIRFKFLKKLFRVPVTKQPMAKQPVNQQICDRCAALDIRTLLSSEDVGSEGNRINLGCYTNLEFDARCRFCIFLDQLLKTSSIVPGLDLFLVSGLSIERLEPGFRKSLSSDDDSYARYVYLIQYTEEEREGGVFSKSDYQEISPCFGLDAVHHSSQGPLGVTKVHQDYLDVSLVRRWIDRCERLHGGTCDARASPELELIIVIDVQESKIVPHWIPPIISASHTHGAPIVGRTCEGSRD